MRLNKYEARALRAERKKKVTSGKGLFVYQNNTKGSLNLPKPTASGMKIVPPGGFFQGDDYYMCLLKNNQIKLVKTITPAKEEEMKGIQENSQKAEKLILDQPDVVNEEGKIEQVVTPKGKIQRNEKNLNKSEKLLTEDPIDGIDIILE